MSRQAALVFLRRCREDPALRSRLEALPAPLGLDDLIALAVDAGLVFAAEDLTQAFAVDRRMRQMAAAITPARPECRS
ncbi:Nif11-like leader peptide family natural product precursor [uncultured Tistrella sp.]|uniref:Nif11-like leader peptide family natural product precursor n=1 Tax=Tistrella mobilis TaxID=171437 RepID=UPI000C0943BD|nr:Nif11-like leader peptide family natural product precursor [uncultured Tistrella sp.]MAM76682.1 hypothetical protein [Tistrella sp.]